MAKEVSLGNLIMDTLKKNITFLQRNKIPYAVMGGVALQVWGKERATRDIDITVSLDKIERSKFLNLLSQAGLKLIKQKKLLAEFQLIETHYHLPQINLPLEIDFFVAQTDYQKEVIARSVLIKIPNFEIKVIGPEDLILYKLLSYRIIDQVDVKNLLEEQKGRLDEKYLLFWAKQLRILSRLKKIQRT
jgi:hypothetical protein